MGFVFSKIYKTFFKKELELVLLGLDNSGKTTFVQQLLNDNKLVTPTIGLNIKYVTKGNMKLKFWDIGGQFQFRQNWVEYAKKVNVIIFMVDASNVFF